MNKSQKVNNMRLQFEKQGEAVTHQNFVGNNYTQGLHDSSGSTKDNTIKTGNLKRNNSIHTKYTPEFLARMEQMSGAKKVSKSNNDAAKCSISQNEKTNVPNEVLSNDTDTKIPGILMLPPPLLSWPPPPPPPPPPLPSSNVMSKFDSATNTLKICIDASTQTKISVESGKITLEVSAPLGKKLEIKHDPIGWYIQSTNKDITSDNYCTDSLESDSSSYPLSGSASDHSEVDSGRDTLSGSVSDVSCFGKIWG